MSRELARAKARARMAAIAAEYDVLIVEMDAGGFSVDEIRRVNDAARVAGVLYRTVTLVHEEAEMIPLRQAR